jgi:hypothetical protein
MGRGKDKGIRINSKMIRAPRLEALLARSEVFTDRDREILLACIGTGMKHGKDWPVTYREWVALIRKVARA